MHRSIRSRILINIIGTFVRHALTLVSGAVIAHTLGGQSFGDFSFLLGTFLALRGLLDLSSSQAFYTFIAAKRRSTLFFVYYGAWLAFQFCLVLAFVLILAPSSWITWLWHGSDRSLVALAFLASFAQQTLWATVVQIGESVRQTARVQVAAITVSVFHLILISVMASSSILSVNTLISLIAIEFAIASVMTFYYLVHDIIDNSNNDDDHPKRLWREFAAFCTPMIPVTLVSVIVSFSDTWMLQTYCGSIEQGYYAFSAQFANMSLFVSIAAVNVLWKEFSEAAARGDTNRLHRLFVTGSRTLFTLSAILTGGALFWATDLLTITAGSSFVGAAPALALLLLNTILQSLGYTFTPIFMALERTRALSAINLAYSGLSLIGVVVLIAWWQTGATGMAAKLLGLSIFQLILFDLYLWRKAGWRSDWLFRCTMLVAAIFLGWCCHTLVITMVPLSATPLLRLTVGALTYGLALAGIASMAILRYGVPKILSNLSLSWSGETAVVKPTAD